MKTEYISKGAIKMVKDKVLKKVYGEDAADAKKRFEHLEDSTGKD